MAFAQLSAQLSADPPVNVYITMERSTMLFMGKSTTLFRLGHFPGSFLYVYHVYQLRRWFDSSISWTKRKLGVWVSQSSTTSWFHNFCAGGAQGIPGHPSRRVELCGIPSQQRNWRNRGDRSEKYQILVPDIIAIPIVSPIPINSYDIGENGFFATEPQDFFSSHRGQDFFDSRRSLTIFAWKRANRW